ncbi:hypothetical protein H9I32_11490 [Bacillus sp. Xin]|uniref:hypothetical protein n=1 Tax=unclassified Bacillus (in: firmicutes) TaxID=185979 RepID=UPI0015745AF9|nr:MULTISPECIES: hypothetical protein [unclassified Bacillus (in: firmicutes)]MBC6972979.1 hypothetical protein [Bacillus sp. Xin]NSW39679.1 hypothetical protein [Bacillus sp. Xin1]
MCEHKYQVLDSETTSFYADKKQFGIDISATFYCEKCLDIQHRDKRIEMGAIDVKDNDKPNKSVKGLGTVTHKSYY